MPIETVDVISTMMDGARYDTDQQVLTVTMRTGKSYDAQITPAQWEDFKAAESKGSWFRTQIMGLDH